MFMFYNMKTGYLHASQTVTRFIPGLGEYLDYVPGRMVDNYDTLELAALAWPDATLRVFDQ